MQSTARNSKTIGLVVGLSMVAFLSACGGGSGSTGTVETQEQPFADPTLSTGTPEFTPELNGQLDVIFADGGVDVGGPSNDFIDAQWINMQTCLEVSAQEPVVTVQDDRIVAEAPTDDVIRHINGQILASSSITDVSASIQVSSQDFDGSVGAIGFNLRSIMGRYLWLANNLDERLYPHECAADG